MSSKFVLYCILVKTLMASLIRRYKSLLHTHPFRANVLTSCTLMTTGNIISQSLLQKPLLEEPLQATLSIGHIDLKQAARFALAGLIFVGPTVRGCLVLIDKVFGPTTSVRVLAKKLLVDQVLIAPIFLAGNISVLTLLETHSLKQVRRVLDKSYLELLKINYTFWPFVQVINFYYVPLTYRVLFGSSAALIWITILSLRLSKNKPLQSEPIEQS